MALTLHERVSDSAVQSLVLGAIAVALAIARLLQLGVEQRRLSRSLHDSADLLYREARTDTLTGLGNRLALDEHLRTRVEHEARLPAAERSSLTVLFVDVDHFKRFNDALGHAVGDGLLVEVAARVVASAGDHAYRIGGDEFVAVVDGLDDAGTALLSDRLIRSFDPPVVVEDHEMAATVSVGAAHWSGGDTDPEPDASELLQRADLALYRAKELGRGRSAVFDPAMAGRAEQQRQLRHGLQRAADAGELEVHFEPVARLRDHRLVGLTASLQWRSAAHGLLGPDIIGPVAIEGSLIAATAGALFDGILTALRDADDVVTARAATPLWVGTRLSLEELVHPAVEELVVACLERSGVEPSRLHIDITEDTVIDDTALETVAGLRGLGVHVTVERFGTGPSSLMRLSHYPANAIRLDRSFVEGLGRRRDDTVIVTAVAGLAADLGLELSADGIDEDFQATYLEGLGFTTGRGRFLDAAGPNSGVPVHRTVVPAATSRSTPR